MTNMLRRIATLEAAHQRSAPGPGISALLAWAQRGHPTAQWWQELGEIISESPYRAQLQELPGLEGLLAEAIRWREEHPR